MAHQLFKLTQKLYGVPHLISSQSFNNILSYLGSRNAEMLTIPDVNYDKKALDDLDILSGVGVISIFGPLTYKTTGFEALCGGCSYESIVEQCENLIEDGASCILLNIDSGGGEAYFAFECANTIRSMCDVAGIPIYGYVDGTCASAAYAIGCACDELVCNPQGEVGSVGVLISICDTSKAMEMEGLKPVFISAGTEKIPYADDGSFRPEFLQDLQSKVDFLYDSFCEHVSTYTGLSVEVVRATEARTYMAKDALSFGLINKIMSNSEFVDYIVAKQKGAV